MNYQRIFFELIIKGFKGNDTTKSFIKSINFTSKIKCLLNLYLRTLPQTMPGGPGFCHRGIRGNIDCIDPKSIVHDAGTMRLQR